MIISRPYAFNDNDYLSRVFNEALIPMIECMDPRSINAISKVSRFFCDLIKKNPIVWKMQADQLGLVYSDPKQEVRAYGELSESKKRIYNFVKSVIGPLSVENFNKIPVVHFIKSLRIYNQWPDGASIVVGTTWWRGYVPFIAFSIKRRHRTNSNWIILITYTVTELTEPAKNYLRRLYNREPCGPLTMEGKEQEPKIQRGLSAVALCPPFKKYTPSFITIK